MKLMRNIFFCCIALLAALSCGKEEPASGHADKIRFAPYIPETKGFIENINSLGYKMVIYDYMTKGNDISRYMDGVTIECDANGNWGYSGKYAGKEFLWIDQTSHQFFGWMNMDNELFDTDDLEFDPTERTLSIPTVNFTDPYTPQYDFMYSEVYKRDYSKRNEASPSGGNGADGSEINLSMKHLFTAFRFKVQNMRDADITINSVTLNNVCFSKAAEIFFNYPANVTYTGSSKSDFSSKITSPVTLSAGGGSVNAFGKDDDFMMTWPQTEAEFLETDKETAITINYTQRGITKDKVLVLKDFSQTRWEAGKRYGYTITFTDKEIKLTCDVEPWREDEQLIDFTEVVTVKTKMNWERATVNPFDATHAYNTETGEIIIKQNGDPAICKFEIDTPSGATWNASLIQKEGHIDAFAFVEGFSSGEVGKESTIKIYATNSAPYAPVHKAILRITVQRGDGKTIVVNNLTPTDSPFHEFTFVQNPI